MRYSASMSIFYAMLLVTLFSVSMDVFLVFSLSGTSIACDGPNFVNDVHVTL